jgi:hypothetical protein
MTHQWRHLVQETPHDKYRDFPNRTGADYLNRMGEEPEVPRRIPCSLDLPLKYAQLAVSRHTGATGMNKTPEQG